MAVAIDNSYLNDKIPFTEYVLGTITDTRGRSGGFQLHRICAYATVLQDMTQTTIKSSVCVCCHAMSSSVTQAALDWQGDQEDDLDDVEVLHHLKQVAAKTSIPACLEIDGRTNPTKSLHANIQSPTFTSKARGRPSSSFRRYSVKVCWYDHYHFEAILHAGHSTQLQELHPNFKDLNFALWMITPKILWADTGNLEALVHWNLQLDLVDLNDPSTDTSWSPRGKRRRTFDHFQQMPKEGVVETSCRENPVLEAKLYKGVRYRKERRTWIAEMRPPKSKNKVSFGDFKCQTQAARAVDAAFHHYGKTDQLNFADTPQILSATPRGLDEKDMLKFVKEQAKWVASMASKLPATPTSPTASLAIGNATPVPLKMPESSRSSGFRSVFETTSSFRCDGADLSVAQPQHSMHITEIGDFDPEFYSKTLINDENCLTVEQPWGIQSPTWIDCLNRSPPIPIVALESPQDFQDVVAELLLEQQSVGSEY